MGELTIIFRILNGEAFSAAKNGELISAAGKAELISAVGAENYSPPLMRLPAWVEGALALSPEYSVGEAAMVLLWRETHFLCQLYQKFGAAPIRLINVQSAR